jgi:hypothetical protein
MLSPRSSRVALCGAAYGRRRSETSQSPRRKVEILGTALGRIPRQIQHFTDSFHPQIQAIEAIREWAEIELPCVIRPAPGRARRTSSEKPRLRILRPSSLLCGRETWLVRRIPLVGSLKYRAWPVGWLPLFGSAPPAQFAHFPENASNLRLVGG